MTPTETMKRSIERLQNQLADKQSEYNTLLLQYETLTTNYEILALHGLEKTFSSLRACQTKMKKHEKSSSPS